MRKISIELTEEQKEKIYQELALRGRAIIKDIGILKIKTKVEPFKKQKVNIIAFKSSEYIKMFVRGLDKFI
jgi:hypothetical protein